MLTVKTERKMWVENEFYDFRNNHKKGVQSNPFSLHANTKDEAVNGFFSTLIYQKSIAVALVIIED